MSNTASDPVDRFIASMSAELGEAAARGANPPIERRKLRTIVNACGRRSSSVSFLADLEDRLNQAGIYTEPPLTDTGLRRDDWVLFSTGPFPAVSTFFSKESDLQRFVEACLGTGVFRNLEPFTPDGRRSCREFRLPDSRRIDLLCQERTKSGVGALVAIELKREHQRGTVQQLIEYLDALKQLYPSRDVKGLIVSGVEDQVAATMLKNIVGYDIKWLCYNVSFSQVFPKVQS